jgi:hypothetical protein
MPDSTMENVMTKTRVVHHAQKELKATLLLYASGNSSGDNKVNVRRCPSS